MRRPLRPGKLRPRSWMRGLRQVAQTIFLLLFLWLLLAARVPKDGQAHGLLLNVFFHVDPFVMAATWISAHAVPPQSFLALITLAVTLVLGRVFCGWVCPFGTLNHFVGWLSAKTRRGVAPRKPEGWHAWQRAKYFLVAGLLVMAVFGCHWVGVFDPLSLFYRSTTTALVAGSQYAVEEGSTAIFRADPRIGPVRVTSISEPVYRFFREHLFVAPRQSFDGSTALFALFIAILLLNLARKRFWCRYLCPLGGLLGVFAKRPVMRLRNDSGLCNDCGQCSLACPAGAEPDRQGHWRSTECYECWNCVAACNSKALTFTFDSPLRKATEARLDVSKRALLAAGLGGVGTLVLMRLTPQAQAVTYNPALIRPPGARPEREFLHRCIQCGLCMKTCPTNAIQPTTFEAGLEGLWTPMIDPQVGYCEYECTLCGQVCPTEALRPMPLEEKKKFKIGLAFFDVSRCLPYAYERNCLICEEHCPISPKAIHFIDTEVKLRNGTTRVLKQPRVDPDLCTGCGICETKCVFNDYAAVRVTSANETRHPGNRPILAGLPGLPPPAAPSAEGSSEGNPYGG